MKFSQFLIISVIVSIFVVLSVRYLYYNASKRRILPRVIISNETSESQGPKSINTSLLLDGDLIFQKDADRLITQAVGSGPSNLTIYQPNGSLILRAANGVRIDNKVVYGDDIAFSVDKNHTIGWASAGTDIPYSLTVSGLTTTSTGTNGGKLAFAAGAGPAAGGDLVMDAGNGGLSNGQVLIGTTPNTTSNIQMGTKTTFTNDMILTNTVAHNLMFDAAAVTGAGKALSITGNAGATGSKGGRFSMTAGTTTYSTPTTNPGALMVVSGGSSFNAKGGQAVVQGGFSPDNSGDGGPADLSGGSAGNTHIPGNARVLPGVYSTNLNDPTKFGSVELGFQKLNTKGLSSTLAPSSILTYADLYLLNNSFLSTERSPLNIYYSKTYTGVTFVFSDLSTTANVIVTRVGNNVTITWPNFGYATKQAAPDYVKSSTGFIDTIFHPPYLITSSSVQSITQTGGVNTIAVASVIVTIDGFMFFTESQYDSTNFQGNFPVSDVTSFMAGSVSYLVTSS